MLGYKKILLGENARRVRLLRDFRSLVTTHDDQLVSTTFDGPAETDESRLTRSRINHVLDEADDVVRAAGIDATVVWTAPPMVGGFVRSVPVFQNIFNLHQYQIPYQLVLDHLDRAIGIYERDQRAARIRAFNPFFWLGFTLDFIAGLPFSLARRAGVDTTKIEDSWVGRLAKFIVWLLGGLAALVVILQALGWLDTVRKWVHL